MIKLQNHYDIQFGFRKAKTESFSHQIRAISYFLINLLNTRDIQGNPFTFIVDRGWRESRLPNLAKVLLCLVRVGVPQVCWAVRYLDKPHWRAVNFCFNLLFIFP